MGLNLPPIVLIRLDGLAMSCCTGLEVVDAGVVTLEGGLRERLWRVTWRWTGGGGLVLRSFGWLGAGGGSSRS